MGLNEEEFSERVFMINWRFECSRGMTHGHRQEDHILPFEHGNHVTRIEGALSLARWMTSTIFQAHLPDRNSAHVEHLAVESRGDLASRHGSIGRIARAHSWSYRSDNPICTRTRWRRFEIWGCRWICRIGRNSTNSVFPRAREVLPPPEARADWGNDSNGAKSNAKVCWIWNSRWVRILPLSERRFHHCNLGKEDRTSELGLWRQELRS